MLRRFGKFKNIASAMIVLFVLTLLGVFHFPFEKDFYAEFKHYPYEGEIGEAVRQLRNQTVPRIQAINSYEYPFIHNPSDKCNNSQQIRIVFVVKSDAEHFNRRVLIRKTWGFQWRFSDVEIRTVFSLGYRKEVQSMVDLESREYSDIIQANFTDSYYNNTIKTMIGLKWLVNYCGEAKFYMFLDDDYYVSTKNVLRFLRDPENYPGKNGEVIELSDDVKLYSGFVFRNGPYRFMLSKWYVSLEEYPYHAWPPFVNAGALILSRAALLDLYYTSFYVKHFRFDDIYIAMLALRAKIAPFHCNEFYPYKRDYSPEAYKHTIASHGFEEPGDLLLAWFEQKFLGNA